MARNAVAGAGAAGLVVSESRAAGSAPPAFTFAFQPIVDAVNACVSSHEALIRGANGESAYSILKQIPRDALAMFDADARHVALKLAARLGLKTNLNLNCLPASLVIRDPSETIEAVTRSGLSLSQIILEVTEEEVIVDAQSFHAAIAKYREAGVRVAIDDFGAGYSGLNMLADFQPDLVKLDLKLMRNIDTHGPRQAIVRAIVQCCGDLGIDLIAEGVESEAEYRFLRRVGIGTFQGYLFAKPAFEKLVGVEFTSW